jgi:hypothetical protein
MQYTAVSLHMKAFFCIYGTLHRYQEEICNSVKVILTAALSVAISLQLCGLLVQLESNIHITLLE